MDHFYSCFKKKKKEPKYYPDSWSNHQFIRNLRKRLFKDYYEDQMSNIQNVGNSIRKMTLLKKYVNKEQDKKNKRGKEKLNPDLYKFTD